jgi:hypothetical protein
MGIAPPQSFKLTERINGYVYMPWMTLPAAVLS